MKKLNISMADLDHSVQNTATNQKSRNTRSSETQKTLKAKRPPVPPKYKHPETHATWTGRGKPPKWLAGLIAQGRVKEDFLIATANTSDPSVTSPNT